MTLMFDPNRYPFEVVNYIQGTREWLDWRKNVITATDSIIIANVSEDKTPYRLWLEKKGKALPPDLSRNPHVNRGKFMEDFARQLAEDIIGDLLLPVCAVSKERPYIASSFDGLSGKPEPTELKCPSGNVFLEVEALREQSTSYKAYFYQVQHQIYTAGSDKGYLAFLSPFEKRLIWFEIGRDDKHIKQTMSDNERFYDLLQRDKAPKIDPTRDIYMPTGKDAVLWERYASELLAAQSIIDRAESEVEPQKAKVAQSKVALIELMKDFQKSNAFGVSLTRFVTQGKVNYQTLIEDIKTSPDKMIDRLINDPNLLNEYRGQQTQQSRCTLTGQVEPTSIVDPAIISEYEQVKREKIPSLSFF